MNNRRGGRRPNNNFGSNNGTPGGYSNNFVSSGTPTTQSNYNVSKEKSIFIKNFVSKTMPNDNFEGFMYFFYHNYPNIGMYQWFNSVFSGQLHFFLMRH